ncbi:MAG: hypothetical protein ACRCYE_05910 [Sarcina sp.]
MIKINHTKDKEEVRNSWFFKLRDEILWYGLTKILTLGRFPNKNEKDQGLYSFGILWFISWVAFGVKQTEHFFVLSVILFLIYMIFAIAPRKIPRKLKLIAIGIISFLFICEIFAYWLSISLLIAVIIVVIIGIVGYIAIKNKQNKDSGNNSSNDSGSKSKTSEMNNFATMNKIDLGNKRDKHEVSRVQAFDEPIDEPKKVKQLFIDSDEYKDQDKTDKMNLY